MQDWKQAFWLATYEWKASARVFILFSLFWMILLVITLVTFSTLEDDSIIFDIFFGLPFCFLPSWMKAKETQLQKVGGDIWAAPPLIMLLQLPVQMNVLVKNRFIVYFLYSFPFQLLLLILLYGLIPDFKEMSVGSYVAFSIIWLSIGIYIGYIMPASDAGDIINWKTMLKASVILVLLAIAVLSLFHFVFDQGIVEWTIKIAQNWPLLSALVSIVLAISGFKYWQRSLIKAMNKLDYL